MNDLDHDPYYQRECGRRDQMWWQTLDSEYREWMEKYSKKINELYTGETEMKLNEVYTSTSQFLKAADLQGKTVRLTIGAVGVHEFNDDKDGKKKQLVLSFQGKEKKLGLNVTNATSIAKILGDNTDDWIGGEIKIYPTTTDFGDKKDVPCIRVVEELPEEADGERVPF